MGRVKFLTPFEAWGGCIVKCHAAIARQKVALLGGHCANSGAVVQPPLGATMGLLGWDWYGWDCGMSDSTG